MSLLVCPEPHAAKAGYDIFAAGGNAMDAAIAAAFVQGVTNHLLCGIGGAISIYSHDGHADRDVIINGEEAMGSQGVPAGWLDELQEGRAEASRRYRLTSRSNDVGHQAIMVPGFVRGCWVAFNRFGSGQISWSQVLASAIRLSSQGYEVPAYSAIWWRQFYLKETRAKAERGVMPRWEVSPDSAGLMLTPGGANYEQGEWFVQADLGRTLQRLADAGGDDFYTGSIGDEIAADLVSHQALVTDEDLRGYRVDEDKPLRGTYRGLSIAAQPFNDGADLIELLQILDHFDLAALGHNTPEYIALVSKVMRAAASDFLRVEGGTRERIGPIEAELVSLGRAEFWADRIRKGDPIAVEAGQPARGTTHLTAADDAGNVVSLNHSIGYGGSGAVTPGLGFLYNGDVGHYNPRPGQPNSIEGGRKTNLGGSTLAVFRGDKPYVVIGAPGGTRIVTSVIQSVLNVVDFGMDMRTAVTVPRFHSQDRQRIFVEPTIADDVVEGLERSGHDVKRSRYQARPQAIRFQSGRLDGGGDPRGQTSADISEYPPFDMATDPSEN